MWVEFARRSSWQITLELKRVLLWKWTAYNSDNMRDLYVNIIRKVKETVSIPVMIKMSKWSVIFRL